MYKESLLQRSQWFFQSYIIVLTIGDEKIKIFLLRSLLITFWNSQHQLGNRIPREYSIPGQMDGWTATEFYNFLYPVTHQHRCKNTRLKRQNVVSLFPFLLQYLGNKLATYLATCLLQFIQRAGCGWLWLVTHLPLSVLGQPAAGSRLKTKAPWASYTFPILPLQWLCTFCLCAPSLARY